MISMNIKNMDDLAWNEDIKYCLDFFQKHDMENYPDMPALMYDSADKQRYQSTIPLLNQLREAFFQRKILRCFMLGIKILRIDSRPLTSRFRVFVLSHLLFLLEKLMVNK